MGFSGQCNNVVVPFIELKVKGGDSKLSKLYTNKFKYEIFYIVYYDKYEANGQRF